MPHVVLGYALSVLMLPALAASASQEDVARVLDNLHTAAAQADGERYFSLFDPEAVYIGTDATEVWTLSEFKDYAKPHFSAGRGWTYTPRQRQIHLGQGDNTAWFHELLWNEKYGLCRGTGVLVKRGNTWRIAQYHLTFPIPNALASALTMTIKNHNHTDR